MLVCPKSKALSGTPLEVSASPILPMATRMKVALKRNYFEERRHESTLVIVFDCKKLEADERHVPYLVTFI